MTLRIRRALVLAAGNGDRFASVVHQSKLLQPILGDPLILRTIRTAMAAGIAEFQVVLGYCATTVREVIERHVAGAAVHFSYNPDWHLENGVSALAARDRLLDEPFALLMGDHLFEPDALSRLAGASLEPGEVAVAVDSRPAPPHVVEEATRVRLDGSRVAAIGKQLEPFDALDTGMFVCSSSLFDALRRTCARGDTTLSGGIRDLAARNLVHGVDIGDADWYDIDTLSDLETAEAKLASRSEHT